MADQQVDINKVVFLGQEPVDKIIDIQAEIDSLNVKLASAQVKLKAAITKLKRDYQLNGMDQIDYDKCIAIPFEKPATDEMGRVVGPKEVPVNGIAKPKTNPVEK